jgi:antagonist of KipI
MNAVLIRSAGFVTSVQDLGRIGFRRSGVSLGGAIDAFALRVANILVGNDENAAGLEHTLGTLRLQFQDERFVAWAGGAFSVRLGNDDLSAGRVGSVGKDDTLTMVAPRTGGRAWLAVSGGIDVPLVLGSRSTDLRGNFGGQEGRALRDGDALRLLNKQRVATAAPRISEWSAPANWTRARQSSVLRIVRGPDWHRFTTEAQTALISKRFTVTPDSDRMGARLEGAPLSLVTPGDLLSEAVAPGTLQIPPNGKPILLLGDSQTIGGYPRIAHVITVDLPMAAQLWAGNAVRFEEVSLEHAQNLVREREEDFARFRVGVSLRFP